ncbi:MAG: hypothetical protein ACXVQY_01065 [Actinomycetota bacterium]
MTRYVLVQTPSRDIEDALRDIRTLDGVVSVESVNGAYDIIALVQSETSPAESIRRMPGVLRAVECPVVAGPA